MSHQTCLSFQISLTFHISLTFLTFQVHPTFQTHLAFQNHLTFQIPPIPPCWESPHAHCPLFADCHPAILSRCSCQDFHQCHLRWDYYHLCAGTFHSVLKYTTHSFSPQADRLLRDGRYWRRWWDRRALSPCRSLCGAPQACNLLVCVSRDVPEGCVSSPHRACWQVPVHSRR